MKIIKRIIFAVLLVGGSLGLVSCDQSMRMPKVQGKLTEYTSTALESKLDRLDFSVKDEHILNTLFNLKSKEEVNGETKIYDTSYISHYNSKNEDTWIDYSYKIQENEGVLDGKISAFGVPTSTYFDINQESNDEFDKDSGTGIDVNNGKYKTNIRLTHFLSNFGLIGGEYISEFEAPSPFTNVVLDLHKYNYKGLKLYENDNFFSIEIKITKADLTESREEIINLFEYYFIGNSIDVEQFDYKIILVFEKNKIVELGIEAVVLGESKMFDGTIIKEEKDIKLIQKYVDSTPNEITYNEYEEIEGLNEILR